MDISAVDFSRTTGYPLADLDGDGRVSPGDELRLPRDSGAVRLPAGALEDLFVSYRRVRGVTGAAGVTLPRARAALDRDLNVRLRDASPLRVTDAEARHAHDVLMAAAPRVFNELLATMSPAALDRYVEGLAAADPWRLATAGKGRLIELALKVALDGTPPPVGALSWVTRLGSQARRRLLEAVLQLPSGETAARFGRAIGPEAYRRLIQGPRRDAVIGTALLHGAEWADSAAPAFLRHYRADAAAPRPRPAAADDYVYALGSGIIGDFAPGYLDVNERALKRWGIPAEQVHRLQLNTVGGSDENAERLRAQLTALAAGGKKVIVLGHSKLAADLKVALLRHPQLQQALAGVVLIQPAPIAQLARDMRDNERLEPVAEQALVLMGGSRAALDSLADEALARQPWPGDAVPTLVFATSSESPADLFAALAQQYYGRRYEAPSDGTVALADQAGIEGASSVILPGAGDHVRQVITFTDLCQQVARQLEAGRLDPALAQLVARLAQLPELAPLLPIAAALRRGLSSPAERRRWAARLRALGPTLDEASAAAERLRGVPPLEPESVTRALVATLLERLDPRRQTTARDA